MPDLDDAAREAVRAQVKAVELEAERRLLAALEALAPAADRPAAAHRWTPWSPSRGSGRR